MPATTWIIDTVTGALTIEGLPQSELTALTTELLPPGVSVNCARPLQALPVVGASPQSDIAAPFLRVLRIYHHSVIEGPGRRSVLQTAGCERRCPGCYVPETHDVNSGIEISVPKITARLLSTEGAPRDGVTILGGEPFQQPAGLLTLLQSLKAQGQHIVLYTGFTLEELSLRQNSQTAQILALTDILIDGPFVKELADNAGEWRGSTNQRIIHHPGFLPIPITSAG